MYGRAYLPCYHEDSAGLWQYTTAYRIYTKSMGCKHRYSTAGVYDVSSDWLG